MVDKTLPSALQFASTVHEAVDSMDEERFVSCLTETCTFVNGNADPVKGRADIAEYMKRLMTLIAGIKHELLDVWVADDVIVSRMNVTYTRKDSSAVTVSAVTIWRMFGTEIDDYRVYADVSPLFSR